MSSAPSSVAFYVLSFRVLAGLHSAALLLIMLMASGVLNSVFMPEWLRIPLAVFMVGLVSAFLALCWSHWTAAWHMSSAGRRWAWIPAFCSAFFLALSLAIFLLGLWGTLGLASFAVQHNEWLNAMPQDDGSSSFPDFGPPQMVPQALTL
ncbi:hypothetical protein [Alcaligenes sp. SDU_A2]|uniref:hypothetical protein n=1 Tax=Alcaligenes sp. SDU_A2 TaxID=3136634 RepID=UPI002C976AC4|nr:hypothetical protein [Alcaligenes sp.]HRL25987.1 hypothetical protein [Alcaligenes sp.]